MSPAAGADYTVGVPKGFETLDAPQTSVVDIYAGGRRLGSAQATFTPGSITFTDPASVVALWDEIRADARPRVVRALTGRLGSNSGRSCLPETFPGCGTLEVPVAGVIFNPDFFRVDLVVAPALLDIRRRAAGYLPDPVTGPSLIANLGGGVAGGTAGTTTSVVSARTTASLGRNALRFDASAQSNSDRSVIEVLATERQDRGRRVTVGLAEDRPTYFTNLQGMVGARVETSFDDLLDRSALQGTPIVLFLGERSQVQIFRDGRLLAARTYEAGNQQIDTSSLPSGAYVLTLRIRGISGASREESVFFVKDLSFPPPDKLEYLLEAGLATDNRNDGVTPTVESTPFIKGSLTRRLGKELAGSMAVTGSTDAAVAEGGLRYVTPWVRGGVRLATTSRGDLGAGMDASLAEGRFSLALSADAIESTGHASETSVLSRFDETRQSATVSAGYGWQSGARLQLRGTYRNGDNRTYSAGPTLTYPLYKSRDLRVAFEASATVSNQETLALARITFSWSPPASKVQVSGTAGLRYRSADGSGEDGLGGVASIAAAVSSGPTSLGTGRLRGEAAREDDGTNRLSVGADGQSRYGSAEGSADLEDLGGNRNALYSLFGRTSLGANGSGVAVGGPNAGDAAILADVDSTDQAGSLSVSAGGQSSVTMRGGGTALLPVSPFHIYNPTARSVDGRIIELHQSDTRIPLFPGNVATVRWGVRNLYSIYGRIVDAGGQPIADAAIRGAGDLAGTDGMGYFVVEVEKPGTYQVDRSGHASCTISLDRFKLSGASDVIRAGDVLCR